jgi:hypothetical protein
MTMYGAKAAKSTSTIAIDAMETTAPAKSKNESTRLKPSLQMKVSSGTPAR